MQEVEASWLPGCEFGKLEALEKNEAGCGRFRAPRGLCCSA